MLEQADYEATVTANPPLSWGYFIVVALALAVACAAQVFDPPFSIIITVAALAFVVFMGIRHVFYRRGYGIVWPDGVSGFPYLIACFIVVGIPAVCAIGFGVSWPWLIAAAGIAIATLVMGAKYRKWASERG